MIALVLAGLALARAPADLGPWDVLQEGEIWVGCSPKADTTWCRSRTTISASATTLEAILTDFDHYPQVFLRVTQARPMGDDVVHIVLDMPFPLASRDYVALFTRWTEGDSVHYGWVPARGHDVPVGDAVRLEAAQGEWQLSPVGEGSTEVTYTWNGALGGDFPTWALPRAWRTQGAEVLEWLSDAALGQP